MEKKISIVRYKKDLRVQDHEPLFESIQQGNPIVAIYCFEPCIINHSTYSGFHDQIVRESLIDLRKGLDFYGIPLLIYKGDIKKILQKFNKNLTITLWSHQEIGNWVSYQRDIEVAKRCSENSIQWHEYQTNGVIRKLKDRNLRQKLWKQQMFKNQIVLPNGYKQSHLLLPDEIKKYTIELSEKKVYQSIQPGGETLAHQYLQSFLDYRYKQYLFHVGNPSESRTSCSRLSVALAYGNMTIRQVYQASQSLKSKLMIEKSEEKYGSPKWEKCKSLIKHLNSFISRLHRHDHFIQKFETEAEYETKNIHPFYDQIRTQSNNERLSRFEAGMTGFPLIDAAIRCVKVTGWLNFRLRATLTSFICNTCLQDWKRPASFLAQYRTDYEPGIHYPQFQMQAGTTGINQYRIYNPTKQMIEKDPEGKFVDMWCPELRNVPMPYKAQPWKIHEGLFESSFNLKLGCNYPFPLFDIDQQNKIAKDQLWAVKKRKGFTIHSQKIYKKHGSRKKK